MTRHDDHSNGADADATASPLAKRFRGFLPVVIDVETGGFNAKTDALLEIAAVLIQLDGDQLRLGESFRYLVKPRPGLKLEPASLEVTGIDPHHPLRPAIDEAEALRALFQVVRREVREAGCKRAILVGHNAFFDLSFINATAERNDLKRNPFHPFSSFDTVTLGGVVFGQTVLRHAVTAAGFAWDESKAHSALYDATMTAELFCASANRLAAIRETNRS